MIKTYGQTPKQLFERPHPMKYNRRLSPRNAASLLSFAATVTADLDTVIGAKWAQIPGIAPASRIIYADYGPQKVSLWPAGENHVFGLKSGTACFLESSKSLEEDGKEPDLSVIETEAVIVGLDPIDGWLWQKKGAGETTSASTRGCPLLPLEWHKNGSDYVTSIASVSGTTTLYVGYASGKLKAFYFSLRGRRGDPKQRCVNRKRVVILLKIHFFTLF